MIFKLLQGDTQFNKMKFIDVELEMLDFMQIFPKEILTEIFMQLSFHDLLQASAFECILSERYHVSASCSSLCLVPIRSGKNI